MRKAEDEGWHLYKQCDYEGALKKLDEAIKCNPRNSDAYRKKGDTLNSLEKWDLAIEACQHAIQLDSKNHWAYNVLSKVYYAIGKYDDALNAINRAIQIDPKQGAHYNERANVYDALGLYELQLKDQKSCISMSSNNPQGVRYSNCAYTYLKLKQLESSLEYCNKAIELDPTDDCFYAMRAVLFARLNQHEKALEEFKMLMSKEDFKPVDTQTLIYGWIGKMFLELKDIDSALIHFHKSIEKTTSAASKSRSHIYAGIALYMKGDIKKSFNEFFTAFRLDHTEVMTLLEIGMLTLVFTMIST